MVNPIVSKREEKSWRIGTTTHTKFPDSHISFVVMVENNFQQDFSAFKGYADRYNFPKHSSTILAWLNVKQLLVR